MEELTVSELSDNIKYVLNNTFSNKMLKVVGEISGISVRGQNTYLKLKDSITTIDVIFWQAMLDNKHGQNVEITGKISYWNKSSQIKFVGESIKLFGIGDLHKQYEELKTKYEKAGYFNNRLPLPKTVKNIGIITSEKGAALHDFLYVMKKNNFSGNIYVYNCIVQGSGCPTSVAKGIKFFNKTFSINNISETDEEIDTDIKHEIDLIVITRGGGSLEDLMGFSHPKVIESIHKSKKYIISAVGHEVDNMLSDSVANYRAPTPSIAGEVVSSININKKKKLDEIDNKIKNMRDKLLQILYKYRNNIFNIQNSIEDPTGILKLKLDKLYEKSNVHVKNKLKVYQNRIQHILDILHSNNPEHILEQGFIVLTDNNDDIIYDISEILNNKLKLIHSSGTYEVTIKKRTKRKKI